MFLIEKVEIDIQLYCEVETKRPLDQRDVLTDKIPML